MYKRQSRRWIDHRSTPKHTCLFAGQNQCAQSSSGTHPYGRMRLHPPGGITAGRHSLTCRRGVPTALRPSLSLWLRQVVVLVRAPTTLRCSTLSWPTVRGAQSWTLKSCGALLRTVWHGLAWHHRSPMHLYDTLFLLPISLCSSVLSKDDVICGTKIPAVNSVARDIP